ncbi:hypothetical protein GCM10017322_03880 [Paracoccus aerius]|nr:hypothetical protein GCM10017322_03880 [Paracoccus aerius]
MHMPKHVLISEIEIITDDGRRRRWTAAEKLRIVEETLDGQAKHLGHGAPQWRSAEPVILLTASDA